MKTILLAILTIFAARVRAATAAAESAVFAADFRIQGDVDSSGSAEFALDTMTYAPGYLEIVGPSSVVAGSQTVYQTIWHAGASQLEVTWQSGWRFKERPPEGTDLGLAVLHAGDVSAPTTVMAVASYGFASGHSQESAPFAITIMPRLRAGLVASRQHDPTGNVVSFAVDVTGEIGSLDVSWDLDEDGQFDDATGLITPAYDYRSWSGTVTARARIVDGADQVFEKSLSVVINKPPVANQAVVAIPAKDIGGIHPFLPDGIFLQDLLMLNPPSPFVFNAAGLNRKDSGLVVIVHGLESDAQQSWLTDMGQAIERRCEHEGLTPPNIALMDWSFNAKDPAPMSREARDRLDTMVAVAESTGNKVLENAAQPTAWAGEYLVKLYAVRDLGLRTGQLLADWIYYNSTSAGTPPIDVNRPIHLIGHSAGGFVAGEAARLLKCTRSIQVDRVTMLDTPFIPQNHLALGDETYPNPGTVERFISSWFGDQQAGGIFTVPHTWYKRRAVFKSYSPFDTLSTGENGHGYSYVWYTRETTDPLTKNEAGGFGLSPVINLGTRITKPWVAPLAARQLMSAAAGLPDIVPAAWQTFGNAVESAGTWTLTESADAGIWQDLTLPVTAGTLAFEFHYLTAGDGDFLVVHLGDHPALYQGLDLSLSRDAWLPAEIPLDMLPALNGKLVFTLVSRGGVNAQVQIRNIHITQTEDPDNDGLTVAEETNAGTDSRLCDTDGDGLSDGTEVHVYGTDPVRTDSDGDGQPDAAELAAGTHPLANGSVLRVTAVSRSPQGGLVLNWSGVAGKTYRVMRTQELGSGNYETLAFRVPASVPTTTYVDPSPPPLRAFYWIEVE